MYNNINYFANLPVGIYIANIIGCTASIVYQISAGNSWKPLVSKYDVINKKKLKNNIKGSTTIESIAIEKYYSE